MAVCFHESPMIYASILGEKPKENPLREERLCLGFEILHNELDLHKLDDNYVLEANQSGFRLLETLNGVEIVLNNERSSIGLKENGANFPSKSNSLSRGLLHPPTCSKTKPKFRFTNKPEYLNDNSTDNVVNSKSELTHPQCLNTIVEEKCCEDLFYLKKSIRESMDNISTGDNNVSAKDILSHDRINSESKKHIFIEQVLRKTKIAKLPRDPLKNNPREISSLLSSISNKNEDSLIEDGNPVLYDVKNDLVLEGEMTFSKKNASTCPEDYKEFSIEKILANVGITSTDQIQCSQKKSIDGDIFEIVEYGFLFVVIRYLILYAC